MTHLGDSVCLGRGVKGTEMTRDFSLSPNSPRGTTLGESLSGHDAIIHPLMPQLGKSVVTALVHSGCVSGRKENVKCRDVQLRPRFGLHLGESFLSSPAPMGWNRWTLRSLCSFLAL